MIETNLTIAIPFLVLALAHSVLGERRVLGPLRAMDLTVGTMSRRFLDRLLRFAWHATSLTWFALGLVFLGLDLLLGAALIGGLAAVIMFVYMRAHLAWPLFLLIAVAALRAYGTVGDAGLQVAGWVAFTVLGAAATLHLYWAMGGTRWTRAVIPTTEVGARSFDPPPLATAAVAVALAVFAALVAMELAAVEAFAQLRVVLLWVGVGVLALRAAGDGRLVGFSKSVRTTAFAKADDAVLTPLVVFLAFGVSAAALL